MIALPDQQPMLRFRDSDGDLRGIRLDWIKEIVQRYENGKPMGSWIVLSGQANPTNKKCREATELPEELLNRHDALLAESRGWLP